MNDEPKIESRWGTENVEEDIKTAKKMLGKNTQCSGSEIAFLKEV